jgi:hypothetical protein
MSSKQEREDAIFKLKKSFEEYQNQWRKTEGKILDLYKEKFEF